LLANADVRSRIAELRHEIEPHFILLRITERDERLKAKQWLWDLVRQAITYRALGDFAKMHATGIVRRRYKSVGTGKYTQIVEEYEIDHAAVECLNSIERRAAIETGQEVDRADIKLRGNVDAEEEMLRKAFTFEELAEMDARIRAAASGQVVEVKGLLAETPTSEGGGDDVTFPQSPSVTGSWKD
jgi:hypothetical protein